MPRGPRPDAPGSAHHVMLRGIERSRIFCDTEDYETFLTRLDRLIPELGFRCFAWVLMPNHAHLALRTGRVPLARLMARLGTGYARYFNRRHRRAGHLFQNRYGSRLVEGETDLEGLVIYIHQNPLKARLAGDIGALASFPWCGHGALVGERPERPFEEVGATLELFGSNRADALDNLFARMDPTKPPKKRNETPTPRHRGGTDESACVPPPPDLEALIETVCRAHELPRDSLGPGARNRRVVCARTEVARRAIRELGLPSRVVARALGVSNSTISRALSRGTFFP